MTMLMDPTGELSPVVRDPKPLPSELTGLTVGILDISKARGDVFLDRIDERLQSAGVTTKRFKKPTFTKGAPVELLQEIAGSCDVVVEGLAD